MTVREISMRILMEVLNLNVWLNIFPGCTAKIVHQIPWVIWHLNYEGIRSRKMIGWILTCFWTVSKFLNYFGRNGNTHTCEYAMPDTPTLLVIRGLQLYTLHVICVRCIPNCIPSFRDKLGTFFIIEGRLYQHPYSCSTLYNSRWCILSCTTIHHHGNYLHYLNSHLQGVRIEKRIFVALDEETWSELTTN